MRETATIKSFPDFEELSHSEPNVQAKVLGVLLSDDYRSCFLPRFLARVGLDASADWTSASARVVSATRPLRAYLRERAATVENAESAQAEINLFLGLPPTFKLRRNTDEKLTHPRGWNRRFISEMLNGNPDFVAELGRHLVESRFWLMEEVANTEVDLILQTGGTIIFCEAKWLSDFGPASRKPALKAYELTQMRRQYLAGLYLKQAVGCTVYHLALTRALAGERRQQKILTDCLSELVPSVGPSFVVHHTTWQDVYEVAEECLSANHGLLTYMRCKRAHRGKQTVPLLAKRPVSGIPVADYSKLREQLLDCQQGATKHEIDVHAHSESRHQGNDALAQAHIRLGSQVSKMHMVRQLREDGFDQWAIGVDHIALEWCLLFLIGSLRSQHPHSLPFS